MEKIVLSEQTLNGLIRDIEASLLNRHIFRGGAITGQEILKFAPHKQINNFILFQIYQDWNAHVQNFRHPYFDFDHPEVTEALTRFLNILSRHIRISEADFRPMLEKAIYNTLKLILYPKEVFNKFFFLNNDRIPIDLFRKHAPYFSDYDFIIQSILKFYAKNQIQVVEKQVFFEKMDRVINIFESREDNSIEKYRGYLFNKATGKDLASLMAAPQETPEPPAPQEEPPKKPERPQPPQAEKLLPSEKAALPEKSLYERLAGQRKARTVGEQLGEKKETPDTLGSRFESKPEKPQTPPAPESIPIAPDNSYQDGIEPVLQEPQQVETPKLPEPEAKKPEPVTAKPPQAEPPVAETPTPETQPKPIHQILAERKQADEKKPSLAERLSQEKGEAKTLADSFKKPDDRNTAFTPAVEPVKPVAPEPEMETPAPEITPEEPKVTSQPKPVEEIDPPAPDPAEIAASLLEEQEKPEPQKPEHKMPEPRGFDLFSPAQDEAEPVSLFSDGDKKATLGQQFQSEERPEALHESLSPQRSIKLEQIPVHKQFQFVQKLFGGQSVKFRVILDKLNQTQSYKDAEEVMEKYIFNAPNTRRSDKLSQEFIMLVKNRFES